MKTAVAFDSYLIRYHDLQPGRPPRKLVGLVAAGVEALVATWNAFECGWHAEWLALRAATPPSELDPKL